MATHKSAEKRARQTIRRNDVNSKVLSTVRTAEKKLRAALTAKDAKKAQELLKTFTAQIDKAASKGVVHVKMAARKVGRIAAQIAALK